MSDKFPPRLWGGKDLIDEIREPGKWFAFEVKFKPDDTEFLSLEEHSAIVSELERKLEKAEKTIIDILESPMPWWIDKLAKELLEEVLKKDEKQTAEIEGTK